MTSVRPLTDGPAIYEVDNEDEVLEAEEETEPDGAEAGLDGTGAEEPMRLEPEREEDIVKRMIDPKLPSKREVDMHEMLGHVSHDVLIQVLRSAGADEETIEAAKTMRCDACAKLTPVKSRAARPQG